MFRISLRSLLVIVAFLALAITSLEYASDTWVVIASAVTMFVCFAMLIVAFVDRGARQAFAIGFSIVAICYWAVLVAGAQRAGSNSIELDYSFGRLPTTAILRKLYAAVRKTFWIDQKTGAVVPGYTPNTQAQGGVSAAIPTAYMANRPKREDFMQIGHCWWTLILGYVGGQFASWIYRRRANSTEPC